jgi:hypothetical protein
MEIKIKTNMYTGTDTDKDKQAGTRKRTGQGQIHGYGHRRDKDIMTPPLSHRQADFELRLRSQFCHYIPVKPPYCPHSICLVSDSNFTLKIDTID